MTTQREHWGSKIGFIMATAGSAIGLGSLWRFPYIAGENGGGAFVLLYIIFTIFLGLPIFMGELIIGRASQRSAVQAYSELSRSTQWRLVGWFNVLTSFLILSYYCVVSGWTVNYALLSLMQFAQGKSPDQIREVFSTLYTSGDINIFWHFLFVIMTVGVVFAGIRKGIEYWSRMLTPALLVILFVLFIFACTLSGFKDAFYFIFSPNFAALTPKGVLQALGMALFTLSLGIGIILTYGSYMKPSQDIPQTSFIIGSVSVLVSLFASMMIFPVVFTFGFSPEGGFGLVFQTLPILFDKLPGTVVLSTIFFLLFIFTALTSTISLLEVLVANLMEVLNWQRRKAVLTAGICVFLMGIPSALAGSGRLFGNWKSLFGIDFFATMNDLTGTWMMPVGGLFTVIFLGWVMDKTKVKEEFVRGSNYGSLVHFWMVLVKWVVPVAFVLILLQQGGVIDVNALFLKK